MLILKLVRKAVRKAIFGNSKKLIKSAKDNSKGWKRYLPIFAFLNISRKAAEIRRDRNQMIRDFLDNVRSAVNLLILIVVFINLVKELKNKDK